MPAAIRAQIDLNSRCADGTTPVRPEKVEGVPEVGASVHVFEPEDGVAGTGVIQRVGQLGLVYIQVDWGSIFEIDKELSP